MEIDDVLNEFLQPQTVLIFQCLGGGDKDMMTS